MNDMLIFSPSAYVVTCIYNSFWWVSMVSLVDIAAGDVINTDFIHPHGTQKTFNWHQISDSCYVFVKNIIQKLLTPTTSTERSYICQTSAILSFYT